MEQLPPLLLPPPLLPLLLYMPLRADPLPIVMDAAPDVSVKASLEWAFVLHVFKVESQSETSGLNRDP